MYDVVQASIVSKLDQITVRPLPAPSCRILQHDDELSLGLNHRHPVWRQREEYVHWRGLQSHGAAIVLPVPQVHLQVRDVEIVDTVGLGMWRAPMAHVHDGLHALGRGYGLAGTLFCSESK